MPIPVLGIVCVFAKPPQAGRAKTRLAAAVGNQKAGALARAFFDDTWARVSKVPWARPVLASTEDDPGAFGLERVELWLQGEGDLGERLEKVMRRALDCAPWVIALGADCPAMPSIALDEARAALDTHDAVLGPADDGGYYLLGLRRLPSGLLANLPWSVPHTLRSTLERFSRQGVSSALISPAFDIDEPADLQRLWNLLEDQPQRAPHSYRVLKSLKLDGSTAQS